MVKKEEMKPIGKFRYKCICLWSKDNKYGLIPNTECPAHGKKAKKLVRVELRFNNGK